ncbi:MULTISPECIES: hypothetical protein [Bacteroides]|uniref:hypothetical protein n=1 Tax=Bacteroides TaxID=816 RepID=UPI0013141AD3|nr:MULTISPECIES: hypothetical protein [Bacteroides]MBF7062070.1 hypothetical protein [Bacteroides sp. HF-5613]
MSPRQRDYSIHERIFPTFRQWYLPSPDLSDRPGFHTSGNGSEATGNMTTVPLSESR